MQASGSAAVRLCQACPAATSCASREDVGESRQEPSVRVGAGPGGGKLTGAGIDALLAELRAVLQLGHSGAARSVADALRDVGTLLPEGMAKGVPRCGRSARPQYLRPCLAIVLSACSARRARASHLLVLVQ
jgi:hypothetical protein